MRIKIAERLRPFCHLPGSEVLIPYSCYRLKIYPTRLEIADISKAAPQPLGAINFAVAGPLKDFTIQQDLEKGAVRMWGEARTGFFRYLVAVNQLDSRVELTIEKSPANLAVSYEGQVKGPSSVSFGDKISLVALIQPVPKTTSNERLSLGGNKAQNWERLYGAQLFAEIFPLWHRLGLLSPNSVTTFRGGTAVLLTECEEAIASNKPETIMPAFQRLFLAGFEGMLSPRFKDTDYQGIISDTDALESNASPLLLLQYGSQLIRSLFVQLKESSIHLLPALPPEFFCGRFLNLPCGDSGVLTIEWTKKAMRQAIFTAARDQQVAFIFSQGEKLCRIRLSNVDKGKKYSSGEVLQISAGQHYWFDNFQR